MRFVSQLFQPLITIPKNAKIKNTDITCKSQKLLLECGLIRPTSSGLFALLPLALRALDKLEALVCHHIEDVGGQRISLPALTAAGLWEKTGRVNEELLKVEDRHGKKFLLAPTHEEAVADLLADVGPVSYKQLPLLLYQISDKFRDELRPKHGVLRARSFRMLDAYGAHASREQAEHAYRRVGEAYTELFHALGLTVYKVAASCGDMGGSESHEWQMPAAAGEDQVCVCAACRRAVPGGEGGGGCVCGGEAQTLNSIEVGHTFVLGSRYSAPLGARFAPAAGAPRPLLMTCYGIGITRLLGACLEALSTETALRWPEAIAPFRTVVIGPKEGSKEWGCFGPAQQRWLLDALAAAPRMRGDVLCDDRHALTVGRRLLAADKMGYPNIVVCGKSTLDSPARFELHTNGRQLVVTLEELLSTLQGGGEGGEGGGEP